MNTNAVVLFFAFVFLFATKPFAQNFDINTVKSINENASAFKTSFFKADAQSVIVFSLAAPAATFFVGLKNHDAALKKNALYMLGAFVLSSGTTIVAKEIFKRNRPFVDYPFIVQRAEGGGYSFPSGHTSAAFVTATSLSLHFKKWYVVVPAYLWASSVGYARMYQGVHYPTDVLAGAIVGAGSAWLSFKVQKWMDKKNKKNVTQRGGVR